jgi:hypothetical protein
VLGVAFEAALREAEVVVVPVEEARDAVLLLQLQTAFVLFSGFWIGASRSSTAEMDASR